MVNHVVASPTQPPRDFTPPPSTEVAKIDARYFLQPFVDLLARTGFTFVVASLAIADYCQRVIFATQVVFYRLVVPPSFDPTHPSFKQMLDQLEEKIPTLQQRINQLEQKFWQGHLITRDMEELKKLHEEIYRPLQQLQNYANILGRRTHPFPIQTQLVSVKDAFKDLDHQMDLYCLNKGNTIIEQFKKALDLFTKGGVELPVEIREQLIQTWKALDTVVKTRMQAQSNHSHIANGLFQNIKEMKNQIQVLEKQSAENTSSVSFGEPLKLRNIGSSCYLDSVLQALLCIDDIREQFRNPLTRDPNKLDEHQKRLTIQQELLQFIDSQPKSQDESKVLTQMEFILFLLDGPSLYRLRESIFKSGFHHEFANIKDLTRQLDAAAVAELFIDQFLGNCKFKWQGHATTPVFPGMEFKKPEEMGLMLQVPLRGQARYHRLDRLIHTVLGLHVERERDPAYQRAFDPKEAIIIPGKEAEAAPLRQATPTKVDEFNELFRFTSLPPVMGIHFKRFINHQAAPGQMARLVKDYRPVILPQDGILDLSQYYDAPEGESEQARYKIKSMVVHSGGLHGGHYISLVNMNGKFYKCDDIDPKCYRLITKTEFFSHKDPYMLFLERLPDDQVVPIATP